MKQIRKPADILREHAEVVMSAMLPYRMPRLEVGGGIAEEMLELTEEMSRLETARRVMEERGITAKPTAPYDAEWGQSFQSPKSFLGWVYQGV